MIKSIEDQIVLRTYGDIANGVNFALAVKMLTAEEARVAGKGAEVVNYGQHAPTPNPYSTARHLHRHYLDYFKS